MSGFSLKAIRFCFQFYFYSFTLVDIRGDDQQTFWFPLQMLLQQNSNISSRRASDKLINKIIISITTHLYSKKSSQCKKCIFLDISILLGHP